MVWIFKILNTDRLVKSEIRTLHHVKLHHTHQSCAVGDLAGGGLQHNHWIICSKLCSLTEQSCTYNQARSSEDMSKSLWAITVQYVLECRHAFHLHQGKVTHTLCSNKCKITCLWRVQKGKFLENRQINYVSESHRTEFSLVSI